MPQDLIILQNQPQLSVFCGIQQLPAPQPYRWRAPNPLHTEPQRCPVKCYIYFLISFGWIDGSTTSGGLLCRDMMERRLGLTGARSIYHRRTSPTVYPQLFRTTLFTSLQFNSIQQNHLFRYRETHFLHPFTTHSASNPLPLLQRPILSLGTHCIRPTRQALVPLSHAVKLYYKKAHDVARSLDYVYVKSYICAPRTPPKCQVEDSGTVLRTVQMLPETPNTQPEKQYSGSMLPR